LLGLREYCGIEFGAVKNEGLSGSIQL